LAVSSRGFICPFACRSGCIFTISP
jgi:hypothetical protein